MGDDVRHDLGALSVGGDRVHLIVPPSSKFLRTVRLVAADAAERAGCELDEVEDFRIAADELCHLVMTATDHDLHVSFTTFDAHVVARASAAMRNRNARPELEEVSAVIVADTADWFEIAVEGDALVVEVVKRARHPRSARSIDPAVSPR
jgi:hypothetical protein